LVAGQAIINRYTENVVVEDLLGEAAVVDNSAQTTPTGELVEGPLNILLVGSDYRADPELAGLPWRADTIMVVHVPRTHDRAYIISIQRDLWVEIPPSEDGSWPGGEDKINAAFAHGGGGPSGYRLLARTLSEIMGIEFHTGALINFYGFTDVVSALGGVVMCVEVPPGELVLVSAHPPHREFRPGCQHLDGHAALDYVRQRYQFPDGDFARIRHQQQFLQAIVDRAVSSGVIENLGQLDEVIRAAGRSLIIDRSIPLPDLVFTLRRIGPDDLTAIRIPLEEHNGSVYYTTMTPEWEELFQALRDGQMSQWVIDHPEYVVAL